MSQLFFLFVCLNRPYERRSYVANIYHWFNDLYSSYNVAFVDRTRQIVRFENSKGWYEEVTLTEELAFWILTKGVSVLYEN